MICSREIKDGCCKSNEVEVGKHSVAQMSIEWKYEAPGATEITSSWTCCHGPSMDAKTLVNRLACFSMWMRALSIRWKESVSFPFASQEDVI